MTSLKKSPHIGVMKNHVNSPRNGIAPQHRGGYGREDKLMEEEEMLKLLLMSNRTKKLTFHSKPHIYTVQNKL